MDYVTFDDLITNQYLQEFPVEIQGVGTVLLVELSADRAEEISSGQSEIIDRLNDFPTKKTKDQREKAKAIMDELEFYVAKHSLWFVKRSEPLDEEVAVFRKKNSVATIKKLFEDGIGSAPPPIDVEAAEKNSQTSQN